MRPLFFSRVQAPPEPNVSATRGASTTASTTAPAIAALRPRTLAVLLYLAVCAALLLRLAAGIGAALRMWFRAQPVSPHSLFDLTAGLARGLRLRSSFDVSSPVTIGSGILLPSDFVEWDAEKLRIVLAHERSHVRQGDFYLQTLASLYAVLFWFSPLGWWLRRKLSDLSETISDRAGLSEAASRSSYAQVLIEFAALPRPTLIGVAMARTSNLSHRIDRLLNDSGFRQAFAGSRRALLAVLLVPAALFATTALVRVEAAAAPQAAALSQAPAQTSGQATPDQVQPAVAAQEAAPAPLASPAPEPEPAALAEPAVDREPAPSPAWNHAQRRGYSYSYSRDGESYGLVSGQGEKITFSGNWDDNSRAVIDKARKLARGKFLWFTHNGRSYFLDDPAIVAQIEAMYKPMDALGKQQEELGRRQEELSKQQEELARKMEKASVPTPDMSKEIDELEKQMAKLRAMRGKNMTSEEWAELESKLGSLQGRMGAIQGQIGAIQGDFGGKMGKLGGMQGELGSQQGRLGAEQGRLAMEADRKVKSIIVESLSNGKAHPVE
jgi:hypothetical protein